MIVAAIFIMHMLMAVVMTAATSIRRMFMVVMMVMCMIKRAAGCTEGQAAGTQKAAGEGFDQFAHVINPFV